MTTSRLRSTRRLAFSNTISQTCTWRCGGSSKVELVTSAFLTVRSMSVTSSWALVDEQHDEVDFGIIGVDGVGQSLEQNGFAGARRGHDKASLAASDGGHEVDDPLERFFSPFSMTS